MNGMKVQFCPNSFYAPNITYIGFPFSRFEEHTCNFTYR